VIKIWIATSFLFLKTISSDVIQMRELFSNMSKDKKIAQQLITLASLPSSTPENLRNAYLVSAEMALAQYKVNPVSKINTFNEGKIKLEKIIQSDTTNLECRYIRYAIQDNTPALLGYTKNKPNDRLFLIRSVGAIRRSDTDLYARVCTYLILRAHLNPQEKAMIDG
jgi:hypothetical protein